MKLSPLSLLQVCAFFLALAFADTTTPLLSQVVHNGTPPTFMTFNAPYVKCRYGSYWCACDASNAYWTCSGNNNSNWTTGTYGSASNANSATNGIMSATSTNWSHRLLTSHTATDPCMCYLTGDNVYVQSPVLPVGGWDLEPSTLYDPIDTVIQLGGPNNQGKGSQSIEYWFRPSTEESVLMVMLAFATEASDHPTYQNAKFYVEVLDSAYNLLDLGYYSDLQGNLMNTLPMQWPYARFLYVPINPSNSTCHIPYCLATPVGYDYYGTNDENKAFQVSECPYAQFNGQVPLSHSNINSQWFKYTQIAFDLSKYAKQHKTVVFRVKAQSCVMNYHWAYGYFAAQMVRGYIDIDVCNHNELWLSVPDGFSENSYVWYAGADSASAQRIQNYDGLHNIFLSRLNGTQIYPYYRCEVKTQAGVPINFEGRITSYADLRPIYQYEQISSDNVYTLKFYNYSTYREIYPSAATGMADTINYPVQYVEWDFGDGSPVETSLSPTHDFADLGYYPVTLRIYDKDFRCCDSVTHLVYVDTTNHVGVQDFSAMDLEVNVFPNPTDSKVSVTAEGTTLNAITVFDRMGRTIKTWSPESPSTMLDLEALPAGTYLLKIETPKGRVTRQVVRN